MRNIHTSHSLVLLCLFLFFETKLQTHFSSSNSDDLSLTLIDTHISCPGGSDGVLSAIASGGTSPYFYEWSDGSQLQTNANLLAGLHSVTVTDLDGCTTIASVILTEPNALLVSLQAVNGFCGTEASVGATPVGGTAPYTYAWSNGFEENYQENIESGVYSLTITDLNNCSVVDSISVQVDDSDLFFDLNITPPTCFGESDGNFEVDVLEGLAPFTYYLNGEISDGSFENLAGGTYVLFISDVNGCSDGTTVFLNEPTPLQVNIISNDMAVEAVPYNGFPPYTFEWNTGDTIGQITNLAANSYTVTITDQNGCSVIENVDVLEPLFANTISSLLELSIFPNPCISDCFLKATFDKTEEIDLRLINSLGREIERHTFFQKSMEHRFEIQDLEAGIYFIRLQTGTESRVEKILVL